MQKPARSKGAQVNRALTSCGLLHQLHKKGEAQKLRLFCCSKNTSRLLCQRISFGIEKLNFVTELFESGFDCLSVADNDNCYFVGR